jgi:DNA-binding CsgD family transcriptional regulator
MVIADRPMCAPSAPGRLRTESRGGAPMRDDRTSESGTTSDHRVTAARLRALELVAECLPLGILLTGADGVVHFANASARRIAAAGDGLTLASERLRATSERDARRLATALAAPSEPGALSAIAVSRPSALRDYTVLIRHDVPSLVLVADPEAHVDLDPVLVAALYGLTRAEARLACALVAGESPALYQKRTGLTPSTVRWTLKQVQSKTGARRQADLVQLLLTGPAGVRLPGP